MDAELARGRRRTLAVLWLTYATFYLGRQNLAASLPALMADTGLGEAAMGRVMSAFFLVYGVSQFINGVLGERLSARWFIAVAMFVSAALNVAFGLASTFPAMAAIWALNAFFQSAGWCPIIKTIARWFPPGMRGRAGGVITTSYQIGSVAAVGLTGLIVRQPGLGWRWAFFVPAALLAVTGVYALASIRDDPPYGGLGPPEHEPGAGAGRLSFLRAMGMTFTNGRLLVAATVGCCVTAVAYGMQAWAPTYLNRVQGLAPDRAAWLSGVLPLATAAGMLLGGWASDNVFGGRRAPVVVLGSAAAAAVLLLAFVLPGTRVERLAGVLAAWALVGLLMGAPQGVLASSVVMDFARPGATATAMGFMGVCAYAGAALSAETAGRLVAAAHATPPAAQWVPVFAVWTATSAAAALLMLPLWRAGHAGAPTPGGG